MQNILDFFTLRSSYLLVISHTVKIFKVSYKKGRCFLKFPIIIYYLDVSDQLGFKIFMHDSYEEDIIIFNDSAWLALYKFELCFLLNCIGLLCNISPGVALFFLFFILYCLSFLFLLGVRLVFSGIFADFLSNCVQ